MENMKDIAIYTLTSELHDAAAIAEATQQFLDSLHMPYVLRGTDYSDYGQHALNLLYVRTGGTEGIFKRLLPRLVAQAAEKTFYLLTSGKSNSLAASMEILSYLRQQGLKGEIIHGSSEVVSTRLQLLARAGEARKQLRGMRLGIVGEPSDWLISSHADAYAVYQRWGITLVEIPMKELLGRYEDLAAPTPTACDTWLTGAGVPPMTQPAAPAVEAALPGAMRIYRALRQLVADYHLDGFTLRCFDLLDAVHNTGCMALARLRLRGRCARPAVDGNHQSAAGSVRFPGQPGPHRHRHRRDVVCPLHHTAEHDTDNEARHPFRVGHRRGHQRCGGERCGDHLQGIGHRQPVLCGGRHAHGQSVAA